MAHSQWKMVPIKQKKIRHTAKPLTHKGILGLHYQDLCSFKTQLSLQNLKVSSRVLTRQAAKANSKIFSRAQLLRSANFYGRALAIVHNKGYSFFIHPNTPQQALKVIRQWRFKRSKTHHSYQNPLSVWNKIRRHVIRHRFRRLNTKTMSVFKPFRNPGKPKAKYIRRQGKLKQHRWKRPL